MSLKGVINMSDPNIRSSVYCSFVTGQGEVRARDGNVMAMVVTILPYDYTSQFMGGQIGSNYKRIDLNQFSILIKEDTVFFEKISS